MRATPGDWKVDWLDGTYGWILDENGNYLFEVVTEDEEGRLVSHEQQVANAHLAAAAPKLLTACKELLSWLESASPSLAATRATAINAIAAAEGG